MFEGTARYRVRRKLGAGGMGVVFEVDDLERGLPVALKTLRGDGTAERVVRLKGEFRALRDLVHPNLVALYELENDADRWFFTMELLRGQPLSRLIKPPAAVAQDATLETPPPMLPPDDELPTVGDVLMPNHGPIPRYSETPHTAIDAKVLSKLFLQITRGVLALHERGKLHLDLKPSNVMVEPEGRAVILDFGLVSERDAVGVQGPSMGTPSFMAPEQALGHRLTEASDWYAFGSMLYLALTGQTPFGVGPSAIHGKLTRPAASLLVRPELPTHLASLVDELLVQTPADRPTGREILGRLERSAGEASSKAATPSIDWSRRRVGVPIGRAREVDDLDRIAASGRLSLTHVTGPSGIGKSEILEFHARRCTERGFLVLQGRCFDRENVPYKMLDPIIDGMVEVASSGMLPSDEASALGKMFPALRSVLARNDAASPEVNEPRELGFRGLVRLFRELRKSQPILVWIDDVQWGDTDSLGFFGELLRDEDPPPLHIVTSARDGGSPFEAWIDDVAPQSFEIAVHHLEVGPLEPDAALALALEGLAERGVAGRSHAETLARESGGSPLWIRLLLASAGQSGVAQLDEVIWSRISALEELELRLVMFASVSVRPLDEELARALIGGAEILRGVLVRPRVELLLREEQRAGKYQILPFHHRVREVVLAHVSEDEKRLLHGALARVLEGMNAQHELLAVHLRGAGALRRAAEHAREAARLAEESLAFERAADLYAIAMEDPELVPEELAKVLELQAFALAKAGKRADAGSAFVRAAERCRDPARSLLLRREALRSFLLAGYVRESFDAIQRELNEIGFVIPATGNTSLAGSLVYKAKTALVRMRERPEEEIDPNESETLDLMWDVSISLSIVEPILSAKFFACHEWLAKKSGSRKHWARALTSEACVQGSLGNAKKVDNIRIEAQELSSRMGPSKIEGEVIYGMAVADLYLGRWLKAHEEFIESRKLFSKLPALAPELGWSQALLVFVDFQLGRIRDAKRWMARAQVDAENRGDLWSQIVVRTGFSTSVLLAAGRVAEAEASVLEAETLVKERNYSLMDGWNLYARCQIDLFRGEPERALKRLDESWAHLKSNYYLHVAALRISSYDARGRAALMCLRSGPNPVLSRRAWGDVRRLRNEKTAWSVACAALIEAGLSPEMERAEKLRDAEAAFERADMLLHMHLVRMKRGQLLGGETGRSLVESSERWAANDGIHALGAMLDVLVPVG